MKLIKLSEEQIKLYERRNEIVTKLDQLKTLDDELNEIQHKIQKNQNFIYKYLELCDVEVDVDYFVNNYDYVKLFQKHVIQEVLEYTLNKKEEPKKVNKI